MPSMLWGEWLYVDQLAVVMMALVGFIGLCVASFSRRYLKGDRQYQRFFVLLAAMLCSVCLMVSANHWFLLVFAWCLSNGLLVQLMVHKKEWKAAVASGRLAAWHFALGGGSLAAAGAALYHATGEITLQGMLHAPANETWMLGALVLLVIAAMTQSAIWPFHRWLVSSLNSPTPVSAIMHAGLVNGGGFLLVRFAPLYLSHPTLLHALVVMGLATAMLGTLWKLMQSDVKRMLACSTMGQMGFMLLQCGLGMFPAAVAHLVWHGMFKAYLFLASGAAAHEKRVDLHYPPSRFTACLAMMCGASGAVAFAICSDKSLHAVDSSLVLVVVAMLAGSQCALTLLRQQPVVRLPVVALLTMAMGALYGGSVALIEHWLLPMGATQPQPFQAVHALSVAVLVAGWLAMLFCRPSRSRATPKPWLLKAYVAALNASQPQARTITAHRSHYHY